LQIKTLDDMTKQYEEIKEVLNDCRLKKAEIQKQLDENIKDNKNGMY
jgi:predicted nuclease with TOPRIM domain